MKILALDIGDVWTGIAISDALGMFARPYKTVESIQLESILSTIIAEESISTIVVGYPKTLRGTESAQTKKVVELFEQLKKKFATTEWVLWDERFSSKQAEQLKKTTSKEEKIASHAIAAAFILTNYLDYRYTQKNL